MDDNLRSWFVGLVLGGVLGGMVGDGLATARERSRAVEAKVARWEVDPGTGATTFVYGAAGPATAEKASAGPARGAHSP